MYAGGAHAKTGSSKRAIGVFNGGSQQNRGLFVSTVSPPSTSPCTLASPGA